MEGRKKNEARVSVFGEDVDTSSREVCSEDSGFGFLLVFAGILLLLNTLGKVPWTVWETLWQYWPLLLIMAGLKIIAGQNILGRVVMNIIGLVVFATLLGHVLTVYAPELVSWVPENIRNYFAYWRLIVK